MGMKSPGDARRISTTEETNNDLRTPTIITRTAESTMLHDVAGNLPTGLTSTTGVACFYQASNTVERVPNTSGAMDHGICLTFCLAVRVMG